MTTPPVRRIGVLQGGYLAVLLALTFSERIGTAQPLDQQTYLKASNTGVGDGFGWCVAASGDTVVIGSPNEDSNATGVSGSQTNNSATDSGAAYVLVRNGTDWSQQAYLKASNTGAGDQLGGCDFIGNCSPVAVSGDTIVIGAPFEDSNATGVNGNQSNNNATDSGAAYVFVRNGTNWSQQAYLKASNTGAGDNFGTSAAISGDTVVIGARWEDSSATGVDGDGSDNGADGSGAAYVFVRSGTNWTQQAYLKASNTDAADYFGWAVAVSGNTVVVGAILEASSATGVDGDQFDNSAFRAGAAYVFVRDGTNWSQQTYLKPSNTGDYDNFGSSVAVSGDTVVITAPGEDSNATGVGGDDSDNSAPNAGAVYVFVREGADWSQQAYLKASNTDTDDRFGTSASVSGDIVIVGARYEDSNATGVDGNQSDNSATNSGAAYVFVRDGTNWSQQAYLKASNNGGDDLFGGSVAVSGDVVVIGAAYESSNATGVNGMQTNDSALNSGAAYIFTNRETRPQIAITPSAQNVTLSWPISAANFVLEAATSLPAVSWSAVTNTPAVSATERSVQLPLTGNARFFRLRQP